MGRNSRLEIFIVLIVIIVLLFTSCTNKLTTTTTSTTAPVSTLTTTSSVTATAPAGEYGDAPDGASTGYPKEWAQAGKYPTLYKNNGAHTLSISGAVLGSKASLEQDANDPKDPDGVPNIPDADSDDANVKIVIVSTGIPASAALTVEATSATTGTYYLNVIIDQNMDGLWGYSSAAYAPEWAVKNYAVNLAAGSKATLSPPAFAIGIGNRIPEGAWMRLAITSESINGTSWDGTGEFSSGEIEDHVLQIFKPGSTTTTPGLTIPPGDYGDAPDGGPTNYPSAFAQVGHFPSLLTSKGAHTLDCNGAVLGTGATIESNANDPNDSDGVPNLTNQDRDDGLVRLFMNLVSVPPAAALTVKVSGGTGGTYYLNVLVDLNLDGTWGGFGAGGEAEWAVKNFQVNVPANTPAFNVDPPPFAFSNGNVFPDGAYMRVALTKEKVTSVDWDGTGEFSSGEIEDHVVTLPRKNGSPVPLLVVTSDGPYTFKAGVNSIPVNVTVTNMSPYNSGPWSWSISKISGGIDLTLADNTMSPPIANLAPLGNVVIPFTAKKGQCPSVWVFKAIPDPEGAVSPEGISVSISESSLNLEFAEEELPSVFIKNVECNYANYTGYSKITTYITVVDSTGRRVSGSQVTLELIRPDGIKIRKSGTTSYGAVQIDFIVYTYGEYSIDVVDVVAGTLKYAPDKNVVTSITVDVS